MAITEERAVAIAMGAAAQSRLSVRGLNRAQYWSLEMLKDMGLDEALKPHWVVKLGTDKSEMTGNDSVTIAVFDDGTAELRGEL